MYLRLCHGLAEKQVIEVIQSDPAET